MTISYAVDAGEGRRGDKNAFPTVDQAIEKAAEAARKLQRAVSVWEWDSERKGEWPQVPSARIHYCLVFPDGSTQKSSKGRNPYAVVMDESDSGSDDTESIEKQLGLPTITLGQTARQIDSVMHKLSGKIDPKLMDRLNRIGDRIAIAATNRQERSRQVIRAFSTPKSYRIGDETLRTTAVNFEDGTVTVARQDGSSLVVDALTLAREIVKAADGAPKSSPEQSAPPPKKPAPKSSPEQSAPPKEAAPPKSPPPQKAPPKEAAPPPPAEEPEMPEEEEAPPPEPVEEAPPPPAEEPVAPPEESPAPEQPAEDTRLKPADVAVVDERDHAFVLDTADNVFVVLMEGEIRTIPDDVARIRPASAAGDPEAKKLQSIWKDFYAMQLKFFDVTDVDELDSEQKSRLFERARRKWPKYLEEQQATRNAEETDEAPAPAPESEQPAEPVEKKPAPKSAPEQASRKVVAWDPDEDPKGEMTDEEYYEGMSPDSVKKGMKQRGMTDEDIEREFAGSSWSNSPTLLSYCMDILDNDVEASARLAMSFMAASLRDATKLHAMKAMKKFEDHQLPQNWFDTAMLLAETSKRSNVRASKSIDMTPPKDVQKVAARAMDRASKEGTTLPSITAQHAKLLVAGKPISLEAAERMHLYLTRHDVTASSELLWDAWGGHPGKRWVVALAKMLNPMQTGLVKPAWREAFRRHLSAIVAAEIKDVDVTSKVHVDAACHVLVSASDERAMSLLEQATTKKGWKVQHITAKSAKIIGGLDRLYYQANRAYHDELGVPWTAEAERAWQHRLAMVR